MKLSDAIEKILSMSVKEFIERFSDVLPRWLTVSEDSKVEELYADLEEKDVEVFVVVDAQGHFVGIVRPHEIVHIMGRRRGRPFLPLSTIASALRRARVAREQLDVLRIADIMSVLPPMVKLNDSVEHVVEILDREGEDYAVVVDENNRVVAIISTPSIIKAAKKMRREGVDR